MYYSTNANKRHVFGILYAMGEGRVRRERPDESVDGRVFGENWGEEREVFGGDKYVIVSPREASMWVRSRSGMMCPCAG